MMAGKMYQSSVDEGRAKDHMVEIEDGRLLCVVH